MQSRRQFGKAALAGLSVAGLESFLPKEIYAARIDSTVRGVRLGAITYCFRNIPRSPNTDYIETTVQACVQCGVGEGEIFSGTVQPPSPPNGDAQALRETLRQWRLKTPMAYFEDIRKKFDRAGINLFSYQTTFSDDSTDDEIDRTFQQAKAMNLRVIGTNQTRVPMGPRLVPFAAKYQIHPAFHNHAMVDNPDEVASPQSFEKLLGMSPYFMVNLDIGHFTAGNNDAVAFIRERHDRITHIHVKDRKRNNGPNVAWGLGDTPIKECLRLIKDKRYPIYCLVEYEYAGSGTAIEETQKCMEYMKQALMSD